MKIAAFLILALQPLFLQAFAPSAKLLETRPTTTASFLATSVNGNNNEVESAGVDRRTWIQQSITLLSSTAVAATPLLFPNPALAAGRPPLDDLLYTILRVREATEQESRLIRSGKFKDVQRANVKLAVRFMVENYRLADAFVSASAYLDGNERRIAAGDVGQAAVQNLVTILEYFDSSDVQNLKVGGVVVAAAANAVVGWCRVLFASLARSFHFSTGTSLTRLHLFTSKHIHRSAPTPCQARKPWYSRVWTLHGEILTIFFPTFLPALLMWPKPRLNRKTNSISTSLILHWAHPLTWHPRCRLCQKQLDG